MSVFTHAEILPVDGGYELQWQLAASQQVSIYRSTRAHSHYEHVCDTGETQFRLNTGTHDERQYYLLKTQSGDECHVSQRRFDLDGAPNVRDFGGYKTQDGGVVSLGKLYRAGRLSGLSDADITFFHHLNIQHVFDFRRQSEVQKAPHNLGENHKTTIHCLPISPGSHVGFVDMVASGGFTAQQCIDGMIDVYEDLALSQTQQYKPLLNHLLQAEAPLLINCSAGKDRTGVGAAKILLLLGVDRDTIMADYLLTRRYFPNESEYAHLEREFGADLTQPDLLEPLMTVRPEYLNAYFSAIDANFSSDADYFERLFGIGHAQREAIKARYIV